MTDEQQLSILGEAACLYPQLRPASAYRNHCRCKRCLEAKQESRAPLGAICADAGCTELRLKHYRHCAEHKPPSPQRTRQLQEAACEIPGCDRIHTWYESQLLTSVRPDLHDFYRRVCYDCRRLYLRVIRSHHLNTEQATRLILADSCELCDRPLRVLPNGRREVFIDHDHGCCPADLSCGRCVRGFVHPGCNMLIGQFEIAQRYGLEHLIAYTSRWHQGRQDKLAAVAENPRDQGRFFGASQK